MKFYAKMLVELISNRILQNHLCVKKFVVYLPIPKY